jgi:hypothetical protein
MNVNFRLRKGHEYLWKIAKAKAKEEKISLGELMTRALIDYCVKGTNSIPRQQ